MVIWPRAAGEEFDGILDVEGRGSPLTAIHGYVPLAHANASISSAWLLVFDPLSTLLLSDPRRSAEQLIQDRRMGRE